MNSLLRNFEQPSLDLKTMSVFATGGTGSFGTAFVRRLLARSSSPRIVVYSRDEQKQETMARALQSEFPAEFGRLRFFIGDVRDGSRGRIQPVRVHSDQRPRRGECR